MSTTISVDEAQARLKELIQKLIPGEVLIITENEKPIAKLISEAPSNRTPRKAGSAKGKLVMHHEDEEHLKAFEDYMP